MFKWFGQQSEKKKPKTKQLWEREFNIVKDGLDEEQVVAFVANLTAQHKASQQGSTDSLRSLLKTAVADAEQMVASIKMKAQAEAEAEAARIITQARQEEQEIKRRAEIAVQKEAENILSVANRKAEITEAEKEIREEYKRASGAAAPPPEALSPTETEIEPDTAASKEGKIEQPTQLQEEAPVSEPVEETTEEPVGQHRPKERLDREKTESAQLKSGDSQTLYAGEVELTIAMPVELKMVSKLYNYLQTIPDMKFLRTTGSWDRGTTMTVVLDKPIPLISIISKMPGVEVTPELPQKDSLVKGTSSSLLRAGRKGVQRIKLTLKEVQPL